jgi:uncharacterized Zn finger protein (UPF0148 family)
MVNRYTIHMATFDARVEERMLRIRDEQSTLHNRSKALEERRNALKTIDAMTNPTAYHELRESIEVETKAIQEAETADVDYLLQIMPYVAEYAIEASDGVSVDSALVPNASATATTSGHLNAFGFKVTGTSKKLDVLQRYMVEIEGVEHTSPYIQNIDPLPPGSRVASRRKFALEGMVCQECNVPTVLVKNESRVVCPSCGKTEPFVDFSEANMSFEEQIQMQQDASNYAYKRTSHFSVRFLYIYFFHRHSRYLTTLPHYYYYIYIGMVVQFTGP